MYDKLLQPARLATTKDFEAIVIDKIQEWLRAACRDLFGSNSKTGDEMIPWIQELKDVEPPYCNYLGIPNPIMTEIREKELKNPAAFSNRTLIIFPKGIDWKQQLPFPYRADDKFDTHEEIKSVPVDRIIGINTEGNLDRKVHDYTTTLREALFKDLHGGSFNDKSVQFLLGPEPKSEDMPQASHLGHIKVDGKLKANGGIKMDQYIYPDDEKGWYVVKQGKQRTLIAMYLAAQAQHECLFAVPVSVHRMVGKRPKGYPGVYGRPQNYIPPGT